MFGGASTTVRTGARLLSGRWSWIVPAIDTSLLIVETVLGTTVIAMFAAVAAARVPRSHTTVPDALVQVPIVVETDTKLTDAGSALVSFTPGAGAGPRLVAMIA